MVFLTANFSTLYSQTLKRTYYDWRKTSIEEEFYTNSKGEKDGLYKKYSENGIIEISGNMKKGYWNGIVTNFITSNGRQELASKETWVDGVKNGPASYFGSLNVPLEQGNYENDEKEGIWSMIQLCDLYFQLKEEDKKYFSYVKYKILFVNGQKVYQDGKMIYTYYPSLPGKPAVTALEQNYLNGNLVDEQIQYWPNGKRYMYTDYKNGIEDKWDQEGNLLSHYDRAEELAKLKSEAEEKEKLKLKREAEEKVRQEEENYKSNIGLI